LPYKTLYRKKHREKVRTNKKT